MIKKKDPYIALLDYYYSKFPETVTLNEAYQFFTDQGYISKDELEIIKAHGSTRQSKELKSPEIETSAKQKRLLFELLFVRSGEIPMNRAQRMSPRIMNAEHYFNRLEYIELKEARKSSRLAFVTSMLAILVSLGSLYVAWNSFQNPTVILDSQIQEVVNAIGELQSDVLRK